MLVLTLGIVASCGNGNDKKAPADLALFVTDDLSQPIKMCVATCTTDSQCQNSCPPPSSGISCCDTTTNQCFTSNTASCPVPVHDLSVLDGPY